MILAGSQTERIRGVQEAFGAFRDIILLSLHSFFFNRFKLEDHKYRNSQGINAFIQTSPRIIVEGAAMTLLAVYALYAITQTGGLADAIPILGTMAIGAQRLLPQCSKLTMVGALFKDQVSFSQKLNTFVVGIGKILLTMGT